MASLERQGQNRGLPADRDGRALQLEHGWPGRLALNLSAQEVEFQDAALMLQGGVADTFETVPLKSMSPPLAPFSDRAGPENSPDVQLDLNGALTP